TRPLTFRLAILILRCMKSAATSAVGYIRVSTERQASEGASLEAQKARIEGWATANGLTLSAVHVDAGISGKRADNRPGLQAALADVCKRRGVLVVYSLSRVARSTRDALAISERIEKAGADLVSLSESIDTTSAAGKMVFRMLAVLAEFERDLISERVTSSMDHLRRQGRKVSGNIPFGFDEAEGGRLVANEREQVVLSRIRSLRDAGASLRAIAAALAEAGTPTKSGLLTWTPATIRGVLLRDASLRIAA
ncbi:MAG TPA: recombinase family protein, partial [Thermoanaerobaculia bacterium]|nr:recombinase family protein [Thermoanaerobaculia bacterium]